MLKINAEEYEVLKDLDDKWKWIARDGNGSLFAYLEEPLKDPYSRDWGYTGDEWHLIGEILFQFIQWEDESPYNIAELIEEYEYHNEPVKLAGGLSITKAKYDKYLEEHIKELENENEETEVKDIKWANEEIKKERNLLNDKRYEREVDDLTTGVLLGLKKALNILDKLDEPEVIPNEVEEEQKYYVVKSEGLDGVHYYFTKFDDEMNGLFTLPNDKKGAYRFDDKEKAQAIANYTGNKVEELEE